MPRQIEPALPGFDLASALSSEMPGYDIALPPAGVSIQGSRTGAVVNDVPGEKHHAAAFARPCLMCNLRHLLNSAL